MAKTEELERKGDHVVHLEVGEPDFPTPKVITRAAIQALHNNKIRYTHAWSSGTKTSHLRFLS
ncbi:MAG: hypothetical protein WAW09_07440 [Smithella sp.]